MCWCSWKKDAPPCAYLPHLFEECLAVFTQQWCNLCDLDQSLMAINTSGLRKAVVFFSKGTKIVFKLSLYLLSFLMCRPPPQCHPRRGLIQVQLASKLGRQHQPSTSLARLTRLEHTRQAPGRHAPTPKCKNRTAPCCLKATPPLP